MRRTVAAIDGLNRAVGWLLAAMLAAMTALIAWQVFARYVAGDSLTFSEEVARFLMVWLTMLGAAYALRQGGLPAMNLLPDLLTGRGKLAVVTVAHLVSVAFYLVLVVHGWEISRAVAFQSAPATGLSMMWPMLALSAGGALAVVNTVGVVLDGALQGRLAPPRSESTREGDV
ncbi:TRAP transporter small permease [Nocardiopsis salina]|uniref:TRAP transporter small permease n=1 Tax=Nocardiopsis salina TaxID=245836 RepID=UPI001955286F|nr:TRAP transporter small permease [Nocardiopsis salina]